MLLKISTNIINNPTQTNKYGDLHLQKITQKLSKCNPIVDLLFMSGFQKSENNKRLIWINTANNMNILKHVHNTLSTMINPTTNNANLRDIVNENQQSQNNGLNQLLSNPSIPQYSELLNLIMNSPSVQFFK